MAGEGREFGPDGRKVRVCQITQAFRERSREVPGAEGRDVAVSSEEVKVDDVVPDTSVPQGSRSAGVVSDHPADGAASRCGGVRAKPQLMGSSGMLKPVLDHTRLDDCGSRFGIEGKDAVEVRRGIDDESGSNGIASTCRTGASGCHG